MLRLRFATRSHTLARPTDETWAILVTARWLLTTALPLIDQRGLTLVGVTVAELENANEVQMRLPLEPHGSAVDAALDAVRERFGSKAITRAALLGRAEGLRGASGSGELLRGGLKVVGGSVDETDRAPGGVEQLDAVSVLLGEDLGDRTFGPSREAVDLAARPNAVVELERRSHATAAARST
jgi:hypothetical protein